MNKIISGVIKTRNLWYQCIGKFWSINVMSNDVLFATFDNYNKKDEIIIILHGFSSNKESCLPFASQLSSPYVPYMTSGIKVAGKVGVVGAFK